MSNQPNQQRQRVAMPTSLFGDGGVLSADARGELHMPQFDGSYSVFRILPAPHLNVPGQLEPWRIDRTSFGQWYMPLYIVKSIGMGENRETWVVHDPKDTSPFNTRTSPVMRLRSYIDNAIRQRVDRGWAGLLKGGPGKGAELPMVDLRSLVRAYIPFHKKKAHQPMLGKLEHPGQLAYVLLAKGVWDKMCKYMDEPADGVRTDSGNPNVGYKIGDPIAPEQGVWWVVYKDGHDPRQQNSQSFQQPGQPHNPYGPPPQAGGEDQFRGFGLHYERSWYGQSAAIPADEMGRLLAVMPHLADCVSVVDERSQISRLIRLFKPVIGLIYQVFGDEYADLFSDADRAEALGQLGRAPMTPVGGPLPGQGFGYTPPGFPQPAQYPPAYAPQPAYGPPAAPQFAPPAAPQFAPPAAPQFAPTNQYPPMATAPTSPPAAYPAPAVGDGGGYGGSYGAAPQVAPAYTPPFAGDPFVGQQTANIDPAAMAAATQAGPPVSAYPAEQAPGGPAAYPAPPQAAPGLSPAQATSAIEAAQRVMRERAAAAAAQQRPPQG